MVQENGLSGKGVSKSEPHENHTRTAVTVSLLVGGENLHMQFSVED